MFSETKTKVARPMSIDPLLTLTLGIIIPYKECYKHVLDLLYKLQEVKNVIFSVTLVDDNSDNLDFHKNFKDVAGLKLIRLNEDSGFGFAINQAVKESQNEYFLVLHTDVINFDLNTIKNLFQSLIDGVKDKVAAIPAVMDNPLPKDCDFLKSSGPQNETYKICDSQSFIPFIFTIFHKSPFTKVGGFPTYPYCLFEDKLICAKFHAFGYKIGYSPAAYCSHQGGMTVKKLIDKDKTILDKIKNNNNLFKKDYQIMQNFLKTPKDN